MKLKTSSEVLNTLVGSLVGAAAVRDEAMRTVLPDHHPNVSPVLTPAPGNEKHASRELLRHLLLG
jgi:hypothetical protein